MGRVFAELEVSYSLIVIKQMAFDKQDAIVRSSRTIPACILAIMLVFIVQAIKMEDFCLR